MDLHINYETVEKHPVTCLIDGQSDEGDADPSAYRIDKRRRWAIDCLRFKHDKPSGITDDPDGWHVWADEPFNLIRHLRRPIRVSVETARIVKSLPPSL